MNGGGSPNNGSRIQTTARVFEALLECPAGLTLEEIADASGVKYCAAQRSAAALVSVGFLELSVRGSNRGPGVYRLGPRIRGTVIEAARVWREEILGPEDPHAPKAVPLGRTYAIGAGHAWRRGNLRGAG